jgi:hypothetical protein
MSSLPSILLNIHKDYKAPVYPLKRVAQKTNRSFIDLEQAMIINLSYRLDGQ